MPNESVRRVIALIVRTSAGLDANQLHLVVVDERIEDARRVGPAADARDDRIGQLPHVTQALGLALGADDGLEIADDHREMGAARRPIR